MARIVTVNGEKSPGDLGLTMVHVHLLYTVSTSYVGVTKGSGPVSAPPVPPASDQLLAEKPITIEILGELRRHIYANKNILSFTDVDESIKELMFYKMAGGASVVECSLPGIGRDPVGLRKISAATGVNVICSTGWYTAPSHPAFVGEHSIDELLERMIQELTVGIDDTGIRAGFIKVALSGASPDVAFTGDEEKVLRAAARAQAKTGAGLNIHPVHHFGHARPYDTYVSILKEEGACLDKCCMAHLDFWCPNIEYQKAVLKHGVIIGFDGFGIEYYGSPGRRYATDRMRVDAVLELVKAGYADQMILSNEVGFRIGLRKLGGYGFAHVLENIVPELRYYGVTEDQIHKMIVENPKRLLAF